MVKITKESGSTVVEAVEHTLPVTFGVQASATVTKGYCLSQNSAGNVAHSASNDSIGTFVGVCDETQTGTSVAGAETTRVINHGVVWATIDLGAIAIGDPLCISTAAGTLGIAVYGTTREDRIVGTAWSAGTTGHEVILVKLK